MGTTHLLRFIAITVLLGIGSAGLIAQAPDRPTPHAPPTSIRAMPSDAEKSAWRTKLPWMESSEEATTPRLRGRLYHQEYLSRVTPEGFRRSAMNAAPGMSTDPGRVLHGVRTAWRGRQERLLRESVEKELAALLVNRE